MDGQAFSAQLARYGPGSNEPPPSAAEAAAYCRRLARRHYENFFVTSRLLPRRWRQPLCNVYAYCRWADDLADEVPDADRSLELLAWWRGQLEQCYAGRAVHPVFVALAETIGEFQIPRQPFEDLLEAFQQDQRQARYETIDDLLAYCRRSANPVGRIVLHLAAGPGPAAPDDQSARLSDSICTGLQLANFCQDVARDWQRGRIYLPQESCRRFGVGPSHFAGAVVDDAWRALLASEVDRAEAFLRGGRPLVERIEPDFRWQIDLFIRGGLAILREIRAAGYDVWKRRPTVSKRARLAMLLKTWMAGRHRR